MTEIHNSSSDVKEADEALHQHKTPDGETPRQIDTCDSLTKNILQWDLSGKTDKGQESTDKACWVETDSVFLSTAFLI